MLALATPQYLDDPWYAIFKEWDELTFHSEDISDDGTTADLVVRLGCPCCMGNLGWGGSSGGRPSKCVLVCQLNYVGQCSPMGEGGRE